MSNSACDHGQETGPLALRMAARLKAFLAADLAPEVVTKAKLCLIDYLASAFASRDLPWGRQAIELAGAARSERSSATVIGTILQTGRDEAAFANAVLGHGLVRDDMHLGSVSHLGTVIIPTLLALAESRQIDGRSFLAALVTGYEAGGKLGRSILDVEVAKIFRPTGITGPFAAAAAASKLLELDVPAFASALTLAANTAAGYNEWAATGGTEMFFHPGFAARNALTAVELAAAGAYTSATSLDGAAGMLAAFNKPQAPDTALPFTDDAEILAVFFKEVPACNFAQTAAQVARELALTHGLDAAQLAHVHVWVPEAAALYPGCDVSGPFEHVLQAKMSIHYNVAAALLRGHFEERNYPPAENADITELAASIQVSVDAELTRAYPARQGARIRVTSSDATVHAAAADDVQAASSSLVYQRLLAAATASQGEAGANELLALIDDLDAQPSLHRLHTLLRRKESA